MSRIIMAVFLAYGLSAAGCIERWAYVELTAVPEGAKVRSKGLGEAQALGDARAPTGHFLRCTMDAVSPDVRINEDAWSYVFSQPGHNDEEVFVERAQVAKLCADSRKAAREKPYRIRAGLLATTSEEGLRNAVLITTSPTGATVLDDRTGKVLGKTPLRMTYLFFAPYKQDFPLRLELDGYVPLKRAVNVNTLVLHSNLYRPGETPPPQPPPKTTKPGGSESTNTPERGSGDYGVSEDAGDAGDARDARDAETR